MLFCGPGCGIHGPFPLNAIMRQEPVQLHRLLLALHRGARGEGSFAVPLSPSPGIQTMNGR